MALAFLVGSFFVASCSITTPAQPVGCDPELASGCWEFLGLDDEWISEVAPTPWGLFVGTADHGIFRLETDGGWTPLGPRVWHGRMVPRALLYVPTDPPRLLAGLRFRHDSNDTTRAAVYASFDRGETWEPFDGGLVEMAPPVWRYRTFVRELEVDLGDPQRVFMSNDQGVLRSMDAGETWEFVLGDFNNLSNGFTDILIDPGRAGRLWVSGQGGTFAPFVMVSHDWGGTWDGDLPT